MANSGRHHLRPMIGKGLALKVVLSFPGNLDIGVLRRMRVAIGNGCLDRSGSLSRAAMAEAYEAGSPYAVFGIIMTQTTRGWRKESRSTLPSDTVTTAILETV